MRVSVDSNKCCAHGRCYAVASEFYDVNDDGYNIVPDMVVPIEMETAARAGADACPERAITISD